MKRALCVVVFGLMFSQAQAWQQSGPGPATQAAVPPTSTASTPPAGTTFSSPELAVPPPAPGDSDAVSAGSALQTQIQDALDSNPIFSQERLKVTVRADSIELSGEVARRADRQNAVRMAQSYARGKKVVNHIVVRGHSSNLPENLPANISTPAGHPATSKNSRPRIGPGSYPIVAGLSC